MDAGMHGAHGAAAARLAAEAVRTERESVRALSLVENLALVKRKRRDAAMRGDALVSDCGTQQWIASL